MRRLAGEIAAGAGIGSGVLVGTSLRGGSERLGLGAPPYRLFAKGSHGTADLAALACLLVLTAAFGRPFSKLGVSAAHLYVTEVAIVATAALGVWRCGLRGALDRVRAVVPLVPLLLLWLFGAIALLRGLNGYGVSSVTHDVGLVEYSIFIPLVAIAVDTREKITTSLNVLLVSGIGAAIVFGLVYFIAPHSRIGIEVNPTSGVGLFIASFVVLFAARVLHGLSHGRGELVVGAFGAVALVLMSLLVTRSVLLALLVAAVILIALAPGRMRLWAAGAGAVAIVLSVGGALALQVIGVGGVTTVKTVKAVEVRADPNFVANDAMTAFLGGGVVRSDAAAGTLSREVTRNDSPPYFEVPALRGLKVGERYRVSFFAKPLTPVRTTGRVGDTSGLGWSARRWSLLPSRSWQKVVATLVPTKEAERLVIYVDTGSRQVRLDGLRVTEAGAEGVKSAAQPADPSSSAAQVPELRTRPALVATIGDSFGSGETGSGAILNQRWRLAFWRYMVEQTTHQPFFGVGFGKPAAFHWRETLYDGRLGDPADPNDITGPHNSFVNLLYRTGIGGLLALLALVVIALVRVVRRLRERPPAEERARLVGLTALFAFAVVIASFNVALEGPYMSAFFWTILALLLIVPVADRIGGARGEPGARAAGAET